VGNYNQNYCTESKIVTSLQLSKQNYANKLKMSVIPSDLTYCP